VANCPARLRPSNLPFAFQILLAVNLAIYLRFGNFDFFRLSQLTETRAPQDGRIRQQLVAVGRKAQICLRTILKVPSASMASTSSSVSAGMACASSMRITTWRPLP